MDSSGSWLSLCGVTMSGTLTPDQGLKFLNLEGWWGLTPARGRPDSIPGAHGAFPRQEVVREPRSIALTGEIRTANNRELQAVRDRLEAALSIGAGEMRLFTESSGAWARYVEVHGLTVAPDHGRSYTTFTVDLLAPDPRRYGELQRIGPITLRRGTGGVMLPQAFPWNFGDLDDGGRIIIHNNGSLPVHPTLVIEGGGCSALIVRDITTGRRVRLAWPVLASDRVVFDMETRDVTVGGADVTRFTTIRQWLEIPAGAKHDLRFEAENPTGDPQMWAEFKTGAW